MIHLNGVIKAFTRNLLPRSILGSAKSSGKAFKYEDLIELNKSSERAAACSHLFEFQAGRFLNNDREERRMRATRFDLKGLLKLLENKLDISQSGIAIDTLEVLSEGKSKKLFKIVLKDQRSYVLRIPYSLGNEAHREFRLLSEAATMEFISQVSFQLSFKFRAPIPLAYSRNADNEIKTPYILTSFIPGEKFAAMWKPEEIDAEQKVTIIKQIAEMQISVLKSKFPGYGSIYFANDLPTNIKSIKIDNRFALGPSIERKFWMAQPNGSSKLWGPWSSWSEYLQATAGVQLEHAQSVSGEASANFQVAERYAKIVSQLFTETEVQGQVASPRLHNPNLSPLNTVSQDDEALWLLEVEDSVVKPYVFHSVSAFARNPYSESVNDIINLPGSEELPEPAKCSFRQNYILTQLEAVYKHVLLNVSIPELIDAHHPNLMYRRHLVNQGLSTDINTRSFVQFDYSMSQLMEQWSMLRTGVKRPITYSDTEINHLVECITQMSINSMCNKYIETNGFVPAGEFEELLKRGGLKVLDDKVGNFELTEEFLDS